MTAAAPPEGQQDIDAKPLANAAAMLSGIQAERARRSLKHFFRYSWHVIVSLADPLVWNWHLDAICDHVQALFEGRITSNNLNINVPPGTSKSRIVSVCALAWWWIEHPWFQSINTSANPRIVIRDSIYTRDLVTSRWYQESFKPKWGLTGDQNAKVLYRNTEGGFRLAIGSGAGITGDRGHGLFMDDMLDAAEGDSEASREAFKLWFSQSFANRLNNPRTGIRCHIGQRLHELDPTGVIHSLGRWEDLIIPMEYDAEAKRAPTCIGWSDPRKEDGELLDEHRYPDTVLEDEYTRLGSRGYASQMQQAPVPAGGAVVKRKWIRRYPLPYVPNTKLVLPPEQLIKALGITRIIIAVDTALSEKSSADFTAIIVLGEAAGRLYVLDIVYDRMDAPATKGTIIGTYMKWKASAVVIEGGSSASGKAAAQTLQGMELKMPIIEMPVMSDKIVGMNKVAPSIEAGLLYIPENAEWAEPLITELITFPAAAHDDRSDAVRIGIDYAIFGGGATGLLEFMRRAQQQEAAAKAAEPQPGQSAEGAHDQEELESEQAQLTGPAFPPTGN